MDKECGNIDLIFRNGLKDFEVLPPEEVWTNIQPVVHTSGRRLNMIFKTAAVAASFITISLLSYFISKQVLNQGEDSLTSLSIAMTEPIRFSNADLKNQFIPAADEPEQFENIPEIAAFPEMNVIPADQYKLVDQEKAGINEAIKYDKKNVYTAQVVTKPLYPNLTIKKDAGKRWSISAMASPTYYSEIGSAKDNLSRKLAAFETPVASYTGGFAVSYRISKRISIQTGFFYASQGQRIEGVRSYAGYQSFSQSKGNSHFAIRTSSGTVVSENADIFLAANTGERIISNAGIDLDPAKTSLSYLGNEIIQNFNYLQMPVILRYKVIDRGLDVNVIGGLSYDFLIKNDAYAWVNGSKFPVGETKGLNTLTLSSSLGMGMEYGISEKLSINLEPTFRYFLNPYSEPLDPSLHHYSFGIFSGFSYRF